MSRTALGLILTFLASACSSGTDEPTGGSEPAGQGGGSSSLPPPGGAGGSGTRGTIDPKTGLAFCPEDVPGPVPERCVDKSGAIHCPLDTGYPGDELALCEPGPDEGFLLHYGPFPGEYDDPDKMAAYFINPGVEDENCMFVHTPNQETRHVTNYHGRLRPNSHHLIATVIEGGDRADSTAPEACSVFDAAGSRWLLGSQDPIIDVAIGGLGGEQGADEPLPGDPDYGLAQRVDANTPVRLDLHYINASDEPVIREAWVTLDYVDTYVNLVDMITWFQGAIDVPPYGHSVTAEGTCVANSERYVGLLTGHAHRSMVRTSVWWESSPGGRELVYETYDWSEPGNLYYRDGLLNPTPDRAAGQHGGRTGYIHAMPGDVFSFQCEYQNQTAGTLALGETTNDEMCNVFGMYYPTDGTVWDCTCLGPTCQ